MKKVSLITGGAGFIGSHVAKQCLEMNHEVIILDDLSGGFVDNIPNGAKFIEGSINNNNLLYRIFSEYNIDYVYHLAAYAAEGLSHFIRSFNYENNLMGSINLINLAVKFKVKAFVFTSSIAVYGHLQPPFDEDTIPAPADPYAISKYAVELDLKAAKSMWPDFNYIIFRPHNVFGENQNIGDKYRNVIGIFMNQIMQDQPLTIFGDGNQTRAFSYIDDVAIPIAKSVDIKEAYNEIFNIGADTPYTVNSLVNFIGEAFNKTPKVKYLAARNEAVHAYSNHDKAKQVFGEPTGISIVDGIKKMAEWAKKVGARESQEFSNIEIYENLPDSWKQIIKL